MLSKLSTAFYPLPVGILLIIAALMCHWRRSRIGTTLCLAAALLVLWLPSLPAISDHLRSSLESRHASLRAEDQPRAEAIVVLGGVLGGPRPPRKYSNLTAASDRVRYAALLFAADRAPLIVASGGSASSSPGAVSEAELIAELLVELGVPRAAILKEMESRTTYQNACNTAELLERHRLSNVLLVTSALHMPRALATFRAAGVEAIPAATDFEIVSAENGGIWRWLPDAAALEGSTRALKEYLGISAYRWRGWI